MSLIVYNACKAMKLLIITWVHICISFNTWIWLIQKNDKIDILSLIFMPFTGNKSPGAKKGSDEWRCDNFTNIFWVKRTFTRCKLYYYILTLYLKNSQNYVAKKPKKNHQQTWLVQRPECTSVLDHLFWGKTKNKYILPYLSKQHLADPAWYIQ